MIRIRQVGKTLVLRRRIFEVEIHSPGGGMQETRTPLPVFVLESHVGVAEAWAMVHAASDLWDRGAPDWVEMAT